MAAALRFVELRRRFGRLAVLGGVSGEVTAGTALLVTGANGTGKSTLLRCLAGLLAPDSGTIEYREDGALLDAATRRRRIGYLAPDLAFYGELTVAENLAFFARLRAGDSRDSNRAADAAALRRRGGDLLHRLGLPPDRSAGALSSGMRQRLRWAWALLHRPRLLLLDEPFQNLDGPGASAAAQLLAEHLALPGPQAAPADATSGAAGATGADLADGPVNVPGLAVIASPLSLDLAGVTAHLDLGG